MEKNYSVEIANAVNSVLDNFGVKHAFSEKRGVIRFKAGIENIISDIDCVINIGKNSFLVYSLLPIEVDCANKEMTENMAEFICRANCTTRQGCFELDFDDGMIGYRTFVDCENIVPTEKIIQNNIFIGFNMIGRYASGFNSIISGSSSPKDEIDRCENEHLRKILNNAAEIVEARRNPKTNESEHVNMDPFKKKGVEN